MRRRVREGADPTPLRFRRYDPADWPNPKCHPECAFWEAVEEWRENSPVNLDDPAAGSLPLVVDGPDVPWHPEWI